MLTGKYRLLFLLLFLCPVFLLCGADEMSRRGNREFRRGGEGRGNFGAVMYGRLIAEEKIAAAFPEKYAALEALREKYESELAALAKEANVELPAQRDDSLRQIRKKYPAEFSAIMQDMQTSPRDAMHKLMALAEKAGVKLGSFRGSRRNSDFGNRNEKTPIRQFSRPDLGKLRRKYPEQMREYDTLRGQDSVAARRKLLEIIELDRNNKK